MDEIKSELLTGDQIRAFELFTDFIVKETKTFGLYGFSGTGKTTLLIKTISYLLKYKIINKVIFSAPTNKAVNVMKNKFEIYAKELYSHFTKKKIQNCNLLFDELLSELTKYNIEINFITIHKLLNFEFDFNKDGEMCFVKAKKSKAFETNLVVIDECSMIPAQLIDCIFSQIRTNMNKTKFVFSGDIAQLPPVNEKNSIIFIKNKDDFPFDKYLDCYDINSNDFVKISCLKSSYELMSRDIINMEHFVMKHVVRTKSKNVLGICNTIRDWALGDIENFTIGEYIDSKDCFGYKYKFERKINTNWFKNFITQIKEKKDAIILTWTNRQCDEYNSEIRKNLFNNNNLNKFEIGDVLMLSDFYSINSNDEDINNEKFYTSEQIEVANIEIIDRKIDLFPTSLGNKSKKLENIEIYEEYYKNTLEKINGNISKIYKCWKLEVKRIMSKNSGKNMNSTIYIIHDDYVKIHENDQNFISSKIKKLRKKLMENFSNKSQIIDSHIMKYFWKNYHSIYIQPFANVNYGYSITCHKAQGSTFYNVFVDINDIVKNSNKNEMKRCLYTAVSRTANELHVLV